MSQPPPRTPRMKPIPLPALPLIPERSYRDGQLTPVTPHPLAQQIHEILQPTAEGSFPFFYYDLHEPPSMIIFGDKNCTSATLKMPATTTPLKQLRILLPTPTTMSILVSNPHFVSVIDILETIYSTLHAPISPSAGDDLDLPILNESPLIYAPVPPRGNSYDYHPVKKLLPDAPGRKISYLRGRTTFAGLTRCSVREEFGPPTWKLHTI